MANNIIKRTWNQNRMVNIEGLPGMAFQAEDGGHTFEISGINDANEAVSLSGTVAGIFRRADNADIALTGESVDGVASVTLTEDCYAVNGRFMLTIYLTNGDQKTAIYAAVGTVANNLGGGVAGDTPADVVDLVNAINAAIASLPPDYTALLDSIAPSFSDSTAYTAGMIVWYNGLLYQFTEDKAAGSWDATKVRQISVATGQVDTANLANGAVTNAKLADESVTLDKLAADTVAELGNKADIDGSYESMTVGNAEQLVSSVGIEDSTPYNFRTSGGSVDIGDREELNAVVGGTVKWNQLVENGNFASTDSWEPLSTGTTFTASNNVGILTITDNTKAGRANLKQASIAPIVGHKYFITVGIKISSDQTAAIGVNVLFGSSISMGTMYADEAWHDYAKIVSITALTYNYMTLYESALVNTLNNGDTIEYRNVQAIDLTAMFGSTIANYIYSLEQATAGAGVAWFRKLFPKNYYAYNAGELMSVRTNLHRMVGFNAYNPTTGTAKLVGGNQYQITGAYTALFLDGTTITPDTNGKFTPSASGTLTVTGGNSATTCVHLVWDGEHDGEYEPYTAHEYALDDITLRGILKLDANNSLYADGDRYLHDGTVERRFAERAYQSGDESLTDAITDGTTTVYKLTTSTTETADPYTQTQIVDDFGTEEFVDAAVEANERDVAIPVGNETVYKPNLRAKLEMAPDSPDGDGDYIVRQTNGQNSYIPLVEVKELPDMPSDDGNYTLRCTVTNGTATLSWVSA